jgi:hypothetical protein
MQVLVTSICHHESAGGSVTKGAGVPPRPCRAHDQAVVSVGGCQPRTTIRQMISEVPLLSVRRCRACSRVATPCSAPRCPSASRNRSLFRRARAGVVASGNGGAGRNDPAAYGVLRDDYHRVTASGRRVFSCLCSEGGIDSQNSAERFEVASRLCLVKVTIRRSRFWRDR